ncbi:MAG TPA: tripartite tricarboxylate transporter substrate binding protein [Thermodesulfobacteriota bacterium]|nr:tripartite tricarboxylate transporter substrate binding protein [Thermodesulfobacteriota bacterium]
MLDTLKITAPAAPGGGWDQTARAMQQALQTAGIVRTVQVVNVPGAGGTIGLAQLVNTQRGDGTALMVTGLVMVGAILTNRSPVSLAQTTPVARLTGEYEVVVVPAASKFRTMADLVAALKADPGAVSWAGGSAGGTDHILAGLIAQAVGVDPRRVNYVPFSGGGEALAALLGNQVAAGVSGYGEFAAQIQAGQLRPLAISSAQRVPGIDIPTLKEQGIDVELANWRGVVAPPGLADAERQRLLEAVDRMVKSEAWRATLKQRDWTDLYLPGREFARFLEAEQARIGEVLRRIGLVK